MSWISLLRWLTAYFTPGARRALAKRQRERELRACGVSRSLAKAAAERMTTGSSAPLHLERPRDKPDEVAHTMSYRGLGEPVRGAGHAAAGGAGGQTPRRQRQQRDDRGVSPQKTQPQQRRHHADARNKRAPPDRR